MRLNVGRNGTISLLLMVGLRVIALIMSGLLDLQIEASQLSSFPSSQIGVSRRSAVRLPDRHAGRTFAPVQPFCIRACGGSEVSMLSITLP